MDAGAPAILVALEGSALGLTIRQSVWAYPVANIGHVVFVTLLAGGIAVMDLAMLGVIAARGRADLIARVRRYVIALLVLVIATGGVLFIAEASHVALNPVFQAKMALIALALVNALWLGRRAMRAAAQLPDDVPLPPAARWAALVSLVAWIGVVGLGRFIAYV